MSFCTLRLCQDTFAVGVTLSIQLIQPIEQVLRFMCSVLCGHSMRQVVEDVLKEGERENATCRIGENEAYLYEPVVRTGSNDLARWIRVCDSIDILSVCRYAVDSLHTPHMMVSASS